MSILDRQKDLAFHKTWKNEISGEQGAGIRLYGRPGAGQENY